MLQLSGSLIQQTYQDIRAMSITFDQIVDHVRKYSGKPEGYISLHEPQFIGNEKKYVLEAIDSTFVSSVGRFVDEFEKGICDYTGARYAVATANGTSGLHMALLVSGVSRGDLVITQPLSFIATCNAISYIGAEPIFLDVDKETLGLSPEKIQQFLERECKVMNNSCIHVATGKKISACVPMHTFGHPVKILDIISICDAFKIPVIEDAAESIGSLYQGKHTGTFAAMGVFSFNGNKTITCGGGGVIVTDSQSLAKAAKHLTTQAKVAHPWEFVHDQIGYNYRMPNLNASMACAQLELLDRFIEEKRKLALYYKNFFKDSNIKFVEEPEGSISNYWLNAVLFSDSNERDSFLKYSNENGVMTRPAWKLMNELEMFKTNIKDELPNAQFIADRLVNLPSTPNIK
jgi:aminotransferase in exopolysaccharide biosynthesis